MDMRVSKMLRRQNETKEVGALESPQKALESPLVLLEELFGAVEMTTFKKDEVPFCNSDYHPCSHQKEPILNHSLITSTTLNRTKAFKDEIKKEKPDQWLNKNRFRFKIS